MELNLNFAEATHLVAALSEAPKTRRKPHTDDTEISVLVPNPKKPGSLTHARFELYHAHKTVGEFLAAGGRRVDLAWDLERGHISLSTPIGGGLVVQH